MPFLTPRRTRFAVLALLACAPLFLGSCRRKTPEERYQEAQQLFQEKQVPLAMLKLRDLIAEEPESEAAIEAHFALARIYMQLGRPENYARAVEQTQAIHKRLGLKDPRGFEAYALETDILVQQEQVDKALQFLADGITKAADAPDAKERLEAMHAGLQMASPDDAQQQQGVAFFRRAMMESDKPEIRGQSREVLADFYRSKDDFAQSNAVYQEYIDKFPDDTILPQLLMAQALNLKKGGDTAAADARFREGSDKMLAQVDQELNLNSRMRLLNDLAAMTEAYGDLDGAEKLFRRIMSDQPRTLTAIRAQMAIGQMYARHQQWEKATAVFEQMKRENPQSQVGQQADEYLKAIAARLKAGDTDSTGTPPVAAPPASGS